MFVYRQIEYIKIVWCCILRCPRQRVKMIEYVCVVAFDFNHCMVRQFPDTRDDTSNVVLSSTRSISSTEANAYYDLFKRVIKLVVIASLYSPMHFTFSLFGVHIIPNMHSRHWHTKTHQFFGSTEWAAQVSSVRQTWVVICSRVARRVLWYTTQYAYTLFFIFGLVG